MMLTRISIIGFLAMTGCTTVETVKQDSLKIGTEIQERLGIYLYKIGPMTGTPQMTVFIHGAGGTAESFAGLFSPGKNQIFLFPNLPYVDSYMTQHGETGYLAWPRDPRLPPNLETVIGRSLALESKFIEKVVTKLGKEYKTRSKINIVGFSQGGAQAYNFACRVGGKAGLLVLWASPVHNLTLGLYPDKSTKILVLHNQDDESVPQADERPFYDLLKEKGYTLSLDLTGIGGHFPTENHRSTLLAHLKG